MQLGLSFRYLPVLNMVVNQLLSEYLGVAILMVIGVVLYLSFFFINRILSPIPPTDESGVPVGTFMAYECGEVPIGEADVRFNFQFYVFALAFVIFDLLSVTLFLWAISVQDIGAASITVVVTLGVVILAGFVYWAKKNALTWF